MTTEKDNTSQKSTDIDIISQITKYIPIFTILALSYGTISLYSYYLYFHINIFAFLELNEIILITVRGFLPLLFVGFFYYLITIRIKRDLYMPVLEELGEKSNLLEFIYTLKYAKFLMLFCLLLASTGILSHYIFHIINELTFVLVALPSLFVLVVFTIFIEFNRVYRRMYNIVASYQLRVLIFLSSSLIFLAFCNGFVSLKVIKMDNRHLKNSAIINEKTISSTNTYYYIGSTKSYIFFYNEQTKTSDIYPMGDVSKLSIGK